MAQRFFSWALLFALLIADICCLSIVKGPNRESYDGGSADPVVGYDPMTSGQYYQSLNAPPERVHMMASHSAAQNPPAVPDGSSPPGQLVYRESRARQNQPGSAQAGFVESPREAYPWIVAPPGPFSNDEESPTMSRASSSSRPEGVSQPFPGSQYQAGELSTYEGVMEHGTSDRETTEQGFMPPPVKRFAGRGKTSPPRPEFGGYFPFPLYYYDFRFLTGQYPPGTYTHASNSYEQGRDSWQDAHYVRDYIPLDPRPVRQDQTYSKLADAQVYEVPTPSQTGGSNMKV